ncbi:30S ribosomal protein S6 [bioreactor metagenome]|uniref:30S ribosomal protein S6 n=1 Tax=bioreactor metagenome TaxID=1076179 RepID=A0A645A780_9ZZZZ
MNHYELMYIMIPTLEGEALEGVMSKVTTLIESVNGTVTEVKKWGKRRLAYEINDIKDGFYVVVTFDTAPESISEIDRVLKLTEEVLRFLITKNDE